MVETKRRYFRRNEQVREEFMVLSHSTFYLIRVDLSNFPTDFFVRAKSGQGPEGSALQEIQVTPRRASILTLLGTNINVVLSINQIADHLYKDDPEFTSGVRYRVVKKQCDSLRLDLSTNLGLKSDDFPYGYLVSFRSEDGYALMDPQVANPPARKPY